METSKSANGHVGAKSVRYNSVARRSEAGQPLVL